MERSLVGHGAGQQRAAILLLTDGESLEPIGPVIAKVAFDPDLADGLLQLCGVLALGNAWTRAAVLCLHP